MSFHYEGIVRYDCRGPERGACAFDRLTCEIAMLIAMLIAFLNAC